MSHIKEMRQPIIFMIIFLLFFYLLGKWERHTNHKEDTRYYFKGNISEKSYDEFVKNIPEGTTTVSLSSGGGDLNTALRLGDFILDKKLHTEVGYNASCSSACMYLLISGKTIKIRGKVGLHEPSIHGIKFRHTSGRQRADLLRAKDSLKAYTRYRGFSGEIIEYSYTIKSEDMQYLDGEEFFKYRLK